MSFRRGTLAGACIGAALVGGVTVGCTQDFDQFVGKGTNVSSSQASGSGAAGSTGPASGGSGGGGAGPGGSGGSSAGGSSGCAQGFTCVPAIDDGEYAIRATSVVGCPTGWGSATAVYDGTDPGCSACDCGDPSGGVCAPGLPHRYATGACGGNEAITMMLDDGDCVDVIAGASGYMVEPSAPSGGMCQPLPSDPLPLEQGTYCTAPAGEACGGGMVCVPASAQSFAEACNLLPGDVSCPAAWPKKFALLTTADDTRACDCLCGGPEGVTCAGAGIPLYASDTCDGVALATVSADGNCFDASALDTNTGFQVEAGNWIAASCAAQDNHQGAVAFGGPMTLCCR